MFQLNSDSMPCPETDAWLLGTSTVRRFFPERFDGGTCHAAYPDQLHTFVGDCGSPRQMVALVPEGDVKFTANSLCGENLIAVLGERASADYLEFLEDMEISYVFAGSDGMDIGRALATLHRDFGIRCLSRPRTSDLLRGRADPDCADMLIAIRQNV